MSFDLFVQSCIVLKRMTDVFKRYDDDRDGYITLSFEEFLTGKFPIGGIAWQAFSTDFDKGSLADYSQRRGFTSAMIGIFLSI